MPATATGEPATSAQWTSDASLTVTHDVPNGVISATVIVYQYGDQDATIIASPICMPAGSWTVQWNLTIAGNVSSAAFSLDQDGIQVRKLLGFPSDIKVGSSKRNSDTQWQIEFTNEVTVANSFCYDIRVNAKNSSNQVLDWVLRHDPTIAVVKDPMDG